MSKNRTTLEHFRSFCFQNKIEDVEKAIEYFCVFGGTGWSVNTAKSLEELIEIKILKNYTYIHGDITKITHSHKTSHQLLSALAIGDRGVHSALKRARVSRSDGEDTLDSLCAKKIIQIEHSLEIPLNPQEKVDDKYNFNTPFMRFWFAFVSPFFKSIKEGDYKESREHFANHKAEFYNLILRQLSFEVIKKSFANDPIVEIGSYWDRVIFIDILAKTKSGKIILGMCKNSTQKAKKSDLAKLKEQCEMAGLSPNIFVLVSKSGFSNELKNEKGEDLKLYTMKNMKVLLENLSEKDLLFYDEKKY